MCVYGVCIFDCAGDVCGVCMMCVYTSIAVILVWTPSQGHQNKTGLEAGRHPATGSCCLDFFFFFAYPIPYHVGLGPRGLAPI